MRTVWVIVRRVDRPGHALDADDGVLLRDWTVETFADHLRSPHPVPVWVFLARHVARRVLHGWRATGFRIERVEIG